MSFFWDFSSVRNHKSSIGAIIVYSALLHNPFSTLHYSIASVLCPFLWRMILASYWNGCFIMVVFLHQKYQPVLFTSHPLVFMNVYSLKIYIQVMVLKLTVGFHCSTVTLGRGVNACAFLNSPVSLLWNAGLRK